MNQQQFLDDVENDISYVMDGYYTSELAPIIAKIKTYLDAQKHWNSAAHLPTPNMPLILQLSDGTEVRGKRPKYVADREAGDLGYCDADGKTILNVVKWQIV
jgi:hypothetical protein